MTQHVMNPEDLIIAEIHLSEAVGRLVTAAEQAPRELAHHGEAIAARLKALAVDVRREANNVAGFAAAVSAVVRDADERGAL